MCVSEWDGIAAGGSTASASRKYPNFDYGKLRGLPECRYGEERGSASCQRMMQDSGILGEAAHQVPESPPTDVAVGSRSRRLAPDPPCIEIGDTMGRPVKNACEAIKDAFLECLKTNSFASLSIAEICRTADVARSTFYLHYSRMDDVLNSVIDDILEQIDTVFVQFGQPGSFCDKAFCRFLRSNSKYHPIIMDDSLSDYFVGRLSKRFMDESIERICRSTSLSEQDARQILWFQMHGCFSVTKHNLHCDDKEWQQTKCVIDGFIQRGLFGTLPPQAEDRKTC